MKKVPTPMSVIVMMKVYLRPTRSPSRPKNNAPNGRTAKPAAKASNVKMKAAVGFHAGKELRGQNRRQGAVDIKVVPLEYCTERRSEDDHPLLGCHSTLAVLTRSHCCHGVSPLSCLAGFLFGGRASRALKDCPD